MFVPAQPAWAILVSTSTFLCNNFNNHFYTGYKDGRIYIQFSDYSWFEQIGF